MALNLNWRTLKDFVTGKFFSIALADYGNGAFGALHGLVDTTGAQVDPASGGTLALIQADLATLLAQAPIGGAVNQAAMQDFVAGSAVTLVDAFGAAVATSVMPAVGGTDLFGNPLP